MEFTAKDVQALREKTGCGMMDCKKALVESDGDMDRAIDYLRERGLAAAAKKSGRIAAEGVVLSYADDAVSAIVEVNSETDFVAKNDEFKTFVVSVAKTVALNNPATVEELNELTLADSTDTVAEALREKILKIGENIKIRRFERYEGTVATYIHGGGRIGVMVKSQTAPEIAGNETFKEAVRDVAMQVAATHPLYLKSADVPAEVLEHEKKILTEQVINEGKPAAIAEKIVAGKISKYYKENCLLEQDFVKNGDFTVGKYLDSVASSLGGKVELVSFVRFEKGEGLQKREDNFADEVASMIK
ncbi:MAG: translation elongation factor Ts [Clostridiales bacterium 43-6]|nr:MAG: translation elongation factor Ts [Clostridiales bacterium 43-6]